LFAYAFYAAAPAERHREIFGDLPDLASVVETVDASCRDLLVWLLVAEVWSGRVHLPILPV
jgi:hypothetical protein